MANSRNPLHNLTQTAHDIALYLKKVSPTEFLAIITNVKDTYEAVKKSWIWFAFYIGSRKRVSILDNTITTIQEMKQFYKELDSDGMPLAIEPDLADIKELSLHSNTVNQPEKSLNIIEVVAELIKKGGWEETSANTNLVRGLLKNLPDYDPTVQLNLNEIQNLKNLLLIAIEQRVHIEAKVREEEKKLGLIVIEQEKVKCMQEIETARNTLLLLNPEFDIKKLCTTEIKEMMDEAKLVGEAAVKTYLKERNEIVQRKKEMAEQTSGLLFKRRAALMGLPKYSSEVAVQEENQRFAYNEKQKRLKEERENDVKETCELRAKNKDKNIKSFLETHFREKSGGKQQTPLKEKQKIVHSTALASVNKKESNDELKKIKTFGLIHETNELSVNQEMQSEINVASPSESNISNGKSANTFKVIACQSENKYFLDLVNQVSQNLKLARLPLSKQVSSVEEKKIEANDEIKAVETDKSLLQLGTIFRQDVQLPMSQVVHNDDNPELIITSHSQFSI